MSHEIVKHRFALHFAAPAPSPGRTGIDHFVLFTEFSSSNNVDPRTYDGNVICSDTTMTDGIHEWNGNPMLPMAIWKEGCSADGGGIKAYPGRNVSGTGWISGWQKIARRPIPIAREDGRLAVNMSLSLWLTPERAARYAAGENPFNEWDQARRAAWDFLIVPILTKRQWHSYDRISISNVQELTAATHLLHYTPPDYKGWNDDSFSIFLCLPEWEGEKLEQMQRAIPEPATAQKAKPAFAFAPGMLIELHGHRYQLTEKRKASWLGNRLSDGRLFKIGPKHWPSATLVPATQAA